MSELLARCPMDEFCKDYRDADEKQLNYAAERLDVIVRDDPSKVFMLVCMAENAVANTRENCPMIAILLKKADQTGRTDLPGMNFLRGNTF